jgi:hypothetical protein
LLPCLRYRRSRQWAKKIAILAWNLPGCQTWDLSAGKNLPAGRGRELWAKARANVSRALHCPRRAESPKLFAYVPHSFSLHCV